MGPGLSTAAPPRSSSSVSAEAVSAAPVVTCDAAGPAPADGPREFRFRIFSLDRSLLCGGLLVAASPVAAARAAIERCAALFRAPWAAALSGMQIIEVRESGREEALVDLVDLGWAGRLGEGPGDRR
jgi:hypothetical protein